MSRRHSGVILGGLMLTMALAVSLVGGCGRTEGEPPPRATKLGPLQTLIVLTPHNADIRDTFAANFGSWYLEKRNAPVHIQWIYKGTPRCVEYIRDLPETRPRERGDAIPDVLFGGGISDHAALAEEGLLQPIELGDLMAGIPAEVNGLPTRDSENRWIATGLSSFGIFYHVAGCGWRDIELPTTWADLARPEFYGWLAVAHPMASGSHRECIVLTLHEMGWEKGWSTVMRVLANTRALNARSGDALTQVRSGTALATFAVNFDALRNMEGREDALAYIDPPDGTAVTPDILSIPKQAKNVELARDFIEYVLSAEGQALWSVRAEHRPRGGKTLYHYPILPSVYDDHADQLAVSHNPMAEPFGMQVDPVQAARHGNVIKPLAEAACANGNHVLLQRAWRGIIDAGMPAAALAELGRPPIDADRALELGAQIPTMPDEELGALLAEWEAAFKSKYEKVLGML